MRIFGQTTSKKNQLSPRARAMHENEARKKAEEEFKKRQEEEEKKRLEEEELARYADIESDHHGRLFIDYRQPRPTIFPVSVQSVNGFNPTFIDD